VIESPRRVRVPWAQEYEGYEIIYYPHTVLMAGEMFMRSPCGVEQYRSSCSLLEHVVVNWVQL